MSGARARPRRTLHAESLLRIPLVRAAFAHPALHFRARAIDLRWHYERVVERSLTGFVPLNTALYYGRHSRVAAWLRHPERSARLQNSGDHLATEVMFGVHDFLHAWALAVISDVAPELDPSATGGRRRLDELAFVHLATEAAATIGLDYWYLSTLEPEQICDIGSLKFQFTTSYHERHLAEYRRFRPDLMVQDPAFFLELARFYCDGRLAGFDARDIERSPRLARWLEHEVRYGQRQREYTRFWLAFMSGRPEEAEAPGRAVPCDARWQKAVLRRLAEALWSFVKHGVDPIADRGSTKPSRASREPRFDPRFVNVRTMSLPDVIDAARRVEDAGQRRLLCEQLLCSYEFSGVETSLHPAIRCALAASDVAALGAILAGRSRVPSDEGEPRELFLLG